MRKLLNTLFVINEDAYLILDGENLVVTRNKQETHRYALHTLEGIQSLSARRAWIEITLLQQQELLSLTSLSARRAWNVSLSDCSGWFCSCGYPL